MAARQIRIVIAAGACGGVRTPMRASFRLHVTGTFRHPGVSDQKHAIAAACKATNWATRAPRRTVILSTYNSVACWPRAALL